MATVYGVNKTKMRNAIGSNLIDSGVNKGQVCAMYDTYEASALAAASVIELCDVLPKGSRVLEILVLTDNLQGTATIDIGDVADDDRYASAVDISGQATTYNFPATTAGANIASLGYEIGTIADDDQIALTVNTSAVTGTIKIVVKYMV